MAGFHKDASDADSLHALGKAGPTKNRKLDQGQGSTGTSPPCPQCGSTKTWKDGIRETTFGSVQRYLCRECAYRFSDPKSKQLQTLFNGSGVSEHVETIQTKKLKSEVAILSYCRVSNDPQRRASTGQPRLVQNLAEVETRKEERAAGATASPKTSELVLDYAWQAKKRGLSESTIKQRVYKLKQLVKRGANLMDPDSVLTVLAVNNWTEATKRTLIIAYQGFAKTHNIPWQPPKTRVERKLPFIPAEEEIDVLIAGCGKKTATFLQVLKETGARTAEAAKLRWIDIDEKSCTIRINNPVKGSLARIVKVSPKTIAMINNLPRTGEFVFNPNADTTRKNFCKQRSKIARRLQNPRLKLIHLHTLRHWKATMEYHRTKNIKWVQQLLGHKKLENTDMYTQLINFESDEWHVAHARNLEEESKLIEAGFEYVRYSDKDGVAIYRKRK